MQIEQETIGQTTKKGPKVATIIAILIGITAIVVIAIILLIMARREKELSVIIDGQVTQVPQDTFIFTDDGKIYVSIRDIAPYVGYEVHNGEYKIDIEDMTKMYIEAIDGTETTSFYLNSTTINKVEPTPNKDYESLTIKEPVAKVNEKMYIIDEGFCVGFNSLFGYNKEKNQIIIQTLPNLIEQYKTKISEYGYSEISDEFNNKKALIYGMIVASKDNNSKYGVIDIQGNEILSPRYNKIEFIEGTGEFIITNSSEKVGIAYSTGKTKISVSYDEIKVIDNDLGLYLVKTNNKYGIIDSNERNIIYTEYDQIGIDASKFPNDNIKNQYILYNAIIPAKINNKWILFDIKGNRIINKEYDIIGFSKGSNTEGRIFENALTIGDTKTIIVGNTIENDEVYGGIDVKGNELIPVSFEKIYSLKSNGIVSYYIWHNLKNYSAVDYIEVMKRKLGYEEESLVTNEEGTQSAPESTGNTLQDQTQSNTIKNANETAVPSTNTTNTMQTSTSTTTDNNVVNRNNITNTVGADANYVPNDNTVGRETNTQV